MTDSCTPATCPNGKCNQTGECIEQTAEEMRRLGESFPRVASPPLAPINGFWSGMTDRQRRDALAYRGDDTGALTRTIVAFTGLAGSGKSTAAAHLVNRHGYQRVRFAGPLKAMMAALGCTPAEIDGSEKEVPCELLCGRTPRQAMQWLGTEFGRDLIGTDLWIRAWYAALAKVPAGVPVVVDDLRFPNEAAAVTAAGGVIVRIDRPGAGTSSVHASEQHVLPAAETLRNIADERYLLDQVDILVMDLSWRCRSRVGLALPPNPLVPRNGHHRVTPLL